MARGIERRAVKVTKRSSGGAPERIELERLSLGG